MDISVFSAPLREILAKFRSGAGDGTRTRTPDYRAADFKSAASAIPPLRLFQQSTKSRPSWQCPAASFALDVGCLVMLSACLPPSVRSRSGQPCSPFEAGALPVLRPARPRFRFGLTRAPHESPTSGGYRRIHIRLRGRVLCNPPRLKGFRSAAAPTVTAHGTSGRVRRVESALGFATVPRGGAPASFARHPRRDAVSPGYRLLASLAPVGAIREPHPRVSLRSALGHSPRFLTTC